MVRTTHAITTTTFPIHLLRKDAEKKGQYVSRGSGARSVSHSVGFAPCWICKTTAAPIRDLKDTNAAGSSYKMKKKIIKFSQLHIL